MARRIFLCLALLLLLNACAIPVRIRPQERPMPSSEMTGRRMKTALGARLGSRPTIELTPDLATRAPSISNPTISTPEDVSVFGDLSILPRLDVGIDFNLHEITLRGKYQLVGEPFLDTHAGNFSLAGVGGLGGIASSTNENSASTSYKYSTTSADAAVVAGIRPTDWMLFFSGVSAKYIDYDGSFKSSNATVGNGNFNGHALWWGPYSGIEFSGHRFRYRMVAGITYLATGDVRKSFFSSQGELSVTLGSLEN